MSLLTRRAVLSWAFCVLVAACAKSQGAAGIQSEPEQQADDDVAADHVCAPAACDDGGPCTVDSCNAANQCQHATKAVCGDGACTCDETLPTCPTDCAGGSTWGNGTCDPGETPQNCAVDCGFPPVTLGACVTPGTIDACGPGYYCVARATAAGGNVCVADFDTWQRLPDSHPATDFLDIDASPTGCTADKLTGLTWANATLPRTTWAEALTACTTVQFCGHNDWRLPTVRELLSLIDSQRWDPGVAPEFANALAGEYLTATLGMPDGTALWNHLPLYYTVRDTGWVGLSSQGLVRCVR